MRDRELCDVDKLHLINHDLKLELQEIRLENESLKHKNIVMKEIMLNFDKEVIDNFTNDEVNNFLIFSV